MENINGKWSLALDTGYRRWLDRRRRAGRQREGASLNRTQQGASDPESMSCLPASQGYDDGRPGLARKITAT
jgi:hypothetical protein